MKNKHLKLALLITAFLVVSSLVPVLQILILNFNGGVIYLFESLFGNDTFMNYKLNVILFLLFIVVYILSKDIFFRILSILGFILFFLPFLFYLTVDYFTDEDIYFLQFMIIGLITGGMLMIFSIIKK